MALTEVNSLGLKNSEVKTADIADEAVTIAKLEHGTSGNDGKFLRANNGADPTWETVDTSIADDSIVEAKLDIHNAPSTGQYLKYTSNGLEWATAQTGTDPNAMPKAGGTFTGDVIFDNQSNAGRDITWDESDDSLEFKDNTHAKFGDGPDLDIYHDSGDTYINNSTGTLYLRGDTISLNAMSTTDKFLDATNGGATNLYHDGGKTLETTHNGVIIYDEDKDDEARLIIQGGEGEGATLYWYADDGDDNADKWRFTAGAGGTLNLQNYASGSWENSIECNGNGNVELYYDNTVRLETTASGVTIPGGQYLQVKHDSGRLTFGADDDMQFYHDGSVGRLYNTTGSYVLRADSFFFQKGDGSEHMARFINDGAVELYHDGTKKFETTSEGCLGRGIAHAYGKLDGSGTPHLDHDFGCGAVTDLGTGDYRIALTNDLLNNNQIIGIVNARPTSTSNNQMGIGHVYENSQSAFDISARLVDVDGGTMEYQDWDNIEFAIWDVG